MKASESKTIRIPKPLWQQLKMASAKHDIKIQDLVIEALERMISDMQMKAVPDKNVFTLRTPIISGGKREI